MSPDKLTTCLLSADGSDMMGSRQDVIDTSTEIKCSHFDQEDEGQEEADLGSKCSESESVQEKTTEGDCGNSR